MCHKKCKSLISVVIACLYSVDTLAHLQSMQNDMHDTPVTLHNILTTQPDHMSNIMSEGGALTITGSGTIHFLQAFFYSDTGCTTLLGSASTIDNVSGKVFSSGQTVYINPSSVYQLAHNQGITTGNIACMKLYINGSNQSPNGVSCQSFNDETCSGTTCTSNQTKYVDWVSSPTVCATQYAYVANGGTTSVSQCQVNSSTGALSSCSTITAGITNPYGIALNNNYAYVANSAQNSVSLCTVTASTGALTCSGTTGSGFSSPRMVALNQGFAYVANNTGGTVTKCTVNASTGALSSCAVTSGGFNNPRGISFNNGFAYVTNNGGSTVSQCTVSASTGEFSGCASTGSGFTKPTGIAFNNGFAYVVNNSTPSTVSQCGVDSTTGLLSGCASSGGVFTGSSAVGIAINNGFAYVTNNNSNAVRLCAVGPSTGALSGCATTGSGFSLANQIYIY